MQDHSPALAQAASTLSLIISGYRFDFLAPYSAGMRLTPAEAQALNQLRAERVQTNVRSVVQKALAMLPPGEILPAAELEDLRDHIAQYDHQFFFVKRHEPRRRSALDQEIHEIASAKAKLAFRKGEALGREFDQIVLDYAAQPWVQEEARRRLKAKAELVIGATPEDLL